jgi:hypothetical protein
MRCDLAVNDGIAVASGLETPAVAWADEEIVGHVLDNLITNASKRPGRSSATPRSDGRDRTSSWAP